MKRPSSSVRRFVGSALTVVVLFAIVSASFVHRLGRRQQLIRVLEDSGAAISGDKIVGGSQSISRTNPGWLVRWAASLHQLTGIGEPQRTLRSIRAEGGQFGDEHFQFVSEAKELKHLYLKASEITDRSVPGLAALQELRTLDLSCTRVTDQSLEHLGQCLSLGKLMVNETAITRDAIEQFRDRYPDLSVQWSEAPTPQRRQIICRLLSRGGQLLYANTAPLEDGKRPATVVIKGRWGRDVDHDEQTECLRLAQQLPDLSQLWLHGLNLTQREAKVLQGFHHLRTLRIERMRSQDFHWLESLESLEAIDIADRVPTDQILAHVSRLPHLRSVLADGATDQGAKLLSQCDQLETIRLYSSNISDDCIRLWSNLENLRRLEVDSPKITNLTMETIESFRQLARLDLSNSQIDDQGLVYLQPLASLRVLNLNETNVTPAGFRHLLPLGRLEQLRWVARDDGESEYVDLLDAVMNSFWFELSFASEDELRPMLLRFVAEMSEVVNYSLRGKPIDASAPDIWIETLLDDLEPVRQFRAAVPQCRLQ